MLVRWLLWTVGERLVGDAVCSRTQRGLAALLGVVSGCLPGAWDLQRNSVLIDLRCGVWCVNVIDRVLDLFW